MDHILNRKLTTITVSCHYWGIFIEFLIDFVLFLFEERKKVIQLLDTLFLRNKFFKIFDSKNFEDLFTITLFTVMIYI